MISMLRRALAAASASSPAAVYRRPLLVALLSPLAVPPGPCQAPAPPRRAFHDSPGSLWFRSTPASWSEPGPGEGVGVDMGAEEGLEIARLGISATIVDKLAARGITRLFPIQRAVLEPAMQGKDMIARAQTGTGKTLAFGIPIMDKILSYNEKNGNGRNPLAIVLAPTRELVEQVEKEFRESAPLDTLCVYGGVPINQQIGVLNDGVDIVVGTPGRVKDLLRKGVLNLSQVQFVVLDEADYMLSVGFDVDVEVIMEQLPQNCQSMVFCATMPSWIRKILNKYLKDPVAIDLVPAEESVEESESDDDIKESDSEEDDDVDEHLSDVRWMIMLARDYIDDLFDKHCQEMKHRSHRRFRKLYNDIADDWEANKKLKKAPSMK